MDLKTLLPQCRSRVLLYETASTRFSSCPWSEYIDQRSRIVSLPVKLTVIVFLIIAFKGVFEMDDIILGTTICPRHRDRFGIRWRCNKKNCARPHEWVSHKAVKGERRLTLAQSQKLDLHLTCCSSEVTTTYGRSCSTVAKFHQASSSFLSPRQLFGLLQFLSWRKDSYAAIFFFQDLLCCYIEG